MTFSVGQAQPSGLDAILGGLTSGAARGLQQSLEQYHQGKKIDKEAEGLVPLLKEANIDLEKEDLTKLLKGGMGSKDILGFATDMGRIRESQRAQEQKIQQTELAQQQKIEEKEFERTQAGRTFNKILDKMENLEPYVGTTKIPFTKSAGGDIPFTKAAQKRAQVDTLRLSLEGLFRDLTAKGQFPKAIYERILENLPSSKDSEKRYKGKIEAVRDILEAHYDSPTGELKEKAAEKNGAKRLSLEEIFR